MRPSRIFTRTGQLSRIVIIILSIGITTKLTAQVTFEANVGIGVTAVDLQAWAYGTADDWGLFSGTASAAVFLVNPGPFSIGAEYRFHHFFWYGYYPSGYSYLVDVSVDAHGLMGILRLNMVAGLFLETGFGPYFFSGWTDWGGMLAVGYNISLGEHLYIPIKLRSEVVFDSDTNLYPLRLNAGIGYKL